VATRNKTRKHNHTQNNMSLISQMTPLRHCLAAACVLAPLSAHAHIGYTGRNFGAFSGGEAPVTIQNQNAGGSFGWATATDADFGDSHRLRAYRFTLNTALTFSISIEGMAYSTTAGTPAVTTTHIAGLLPGFSVYSGLAHISPDKADHDGAQLSLDYLAGLPGPAKEGAFRSLNDWTIGNDGPEFNPTYPAASLSHFKYVGHAVDGTAANFGSEPGILGDGLADGRVTGTFSLPAGDYSFFVGGADFASGVGAVAPYQTYGIRATFAPVPEPATAALGLLGASAILFRRRRA
jgi:hypothetical protein